MVRYGKGMIETAVQSANPASVETTMRDELAQDDATAQTVVPILRHLLASDDNSLFSDDIVARMRGMVRGFAEQLLEAMGPEGSDGDGQTENDKSEQDVASVMALSGAFIENTALLRHVHALALEWQLTERLQSRLSLEAVVSPLLQEQIASANPDMSALAMKLLASQARFCQAQRRMTLPLQELPGSLLEGVLEGLVATAVADGEFSERASAVAATLRAGHDEATTRLGLISRLIAGMGGAATMALSVTHSGAAIFLSALAMGSGQDRDVAALSTNEAQLARLALSLCAAGLKPSRVEEQFIAFHPDVALPEGFERLGADRAAAILAAGDGYSGG